MEGKNRSSTFSAAGGTASIFGVLAGLGGLTHGIGETLQGNVPSGGILVNSWTAGPIATHMGGEPAMTLIPNLLGAGILTLIVSLAAIVWSAAFVQRKRGGLILIFLSIALLLVGGGFAPPITGVLAGIAGLGINSPHTWWRTHLSINSRRFLAIIWPWLFGICVLNGVFLVIGSVILVYFFGLDTPGLFVGSFLFSIIAILLSIVVGIAYDIQNNKAVAGS